MRWLRRLGLLAWLAWPAGASASPEQGLPPLDPAPFPASRYELLREYSPFVKSLEFAKITEKSPDLVVVGYGRMKGEDHVIVQQKENSEKREKIGSRYGSKDFPYRLLSVTNTADRKSFVAILEDRNNRKVQIRYASENPSPPPPPGGSSVASGLAQPTAGVGDPPPAPPGEAKGFVGRPTPGLNPLAGVSLDSLLVEIQKLEASINNPNTSDTVRRMKMKALEVKKKQWEGLSTPEDVASPEITPEPAP